MSINGTSSSRSNDFDAYLYFANWGTHRFMLRLPKARVDLKGLKPYFGKGPARLAHVGDHVVLDLLSSSFASARHGH